MQGLLPGSLINTGKHALSNANRLGPLGFLETRDYNDGYYPSR